MELKGQFLPLFLRVVSGLFLSLLFKSSQFKLHQISDLVLNAGPLQPKREQFARTVENSSNLAPRRARGLFLLRVLGAKSSVWGFGFFLP